MATENIINKLDNDINQDCKCTGNIERCHTVLRVWNIKYEIIGTSKFNGVALVQARTLKEAECIFYQNSKFNGFANRIKINCIEEVLPNSEPILLQEDSVAILDKAVLKSYPFLLKEDYQKLLDNLYKDVDDKILTGKSAYQSWLDQGNIGSEEDFIKSLKGDKGSVFIPSINNNCDLSWVLSDGENPQLPDTVNIKGDKGDNGITPHIGKNGNWWIGDTDTAVSAQIHFIDDTSISETDTWSSSKIDAKIRQGIGDIDLTNFVIVEQLPTENISTNVIYLVPKEDSDTIKEQYVYSNGNWILIGDTNIDLLGYYTKQEVDNKIATTQNLQSGIATEIRNGKINLKYDPDFLMIDTLGRLTLKYKVKIWDEMDSEGGSDTPIDQEPTPVDPVSIISNCLKQIDDLDNYKGIEGEIVQYTGVTNNRYTNGWTYQCVYEESKVIPSGTEYIDVLKDYDYLKKGRYYKTNESTIKVLSNNVWKTIPEGYRYFSIFVMLLKIGDIVWDEYYNQYRVTDINMNTSDNTYIKLNNGLILYYDKTEKSDETYVFEDINGNKVYETIYNVWGDDSIIDKKIYISKESRGISDMYLYCEGCSKKDNNSCVKGVLDTPIYQHTIKWKQKDVQPNNTIWEVVN